MIRARAELYLCDVLIACAAVWLLEEEEEIKGGHVPVGGQASLVATCV
jgi:hypothetical protein